MIYRTSNAAYAAFLCGDAGLVVSDVRRSAERPVDDVPVFEFLFKQNTADHAVEGERWNQSEESRYHGTVLSLRQATPFEKVKRGAESEMFLTTDIALAAWLKMRGEPMVAIRVKQGGAREFAFETTERVVRLAVQFSGSACALFDARIRTLRKMTTFMRDMVMKREKRRCAGT